MLFVCRERVDLRVPSSKSLLNYRGGVLLKRLLVSVHKGLRHATKEPGEAMEFCPTCANLLLVEHPSLGRLLRFFCPTCPYVYTIDRKVSKKLALKRKEVDDVLGGEDAWKNVDRTEVTCPQCSHNQAYFMQIQIRSADEPMSTFYKCCNSTCSFQWRDG